MPRRKPQADANAAKYFVPPVKRRAKDAPASQDGAKYFVRSYPIPEELPELWDGTGPDLPEGYDGAEACPDCSAFRFSKHEPLCIRNPVQQTFNLQTAWEPLHTKEQIFFGAGHPILHDVDDYMTKAKQERLTRLAVVVLYDYCVDSQFKTPNDADVENRSVIASWRRRNVGRK